jgi:hypothetical protein
LSALGCGRILTQPICRNARCFCSQSHDSGGDREEGRPVPDVTAVLRGITTVTSNTPAAADAEPLEDHRHSVNALLKPKIDTPSPQIVIAGPSLDPVAGVLGRLKS